MLKVIPQTHSSEREYLLRVVLGDWLGLKFVVNKLNLTEAEFDALMAAPPHSYDEYPNINWRY